MPRLSFTKTKIAGLVVGIVGLIVSLLFSERLGSRQAAACGLTILMASFWLTEALPIYWTALIPLLLCPILLPFSGGALDNLLMTAAPYYDAYIFLFAGGMGLAAAMEQCSLHRRLALMIMKAIGTDPKRILLGVLAATAAVSMWISNTATAAMMLPIALAITRQLEGKVGRRLPMFGASVMLAVAYGANIGGIGTKIGTVPNVVFVAFMENQATQPRMRISFFEFLAVGAPFVFLMLPITWILLWRLGRKDELGSTDSRDSVVAELKLMGKPSAAEKIVFCAFATAATVWIFGAPITDWLKANVRSGWKTAYTEGGIAIAAAMTLAIVRSRGRALLEWKSIVALPWGTLILLGGGFSMASAVEKSGLGAQLGGTLHALREMSPIAQLIVASLATVTFSAVASNVATIQLALPILGNIVAPEMRNRLLFTSTIASSCDFALPAGTPPNAIVFGSGYLTVPLMAKTGFLLDVIAGLIAAGWCYLIVDRVI